jgi:hypothetical protein
LILLAINIPTYERLESFSSIIMELESDLNSLPITHKDMIKINVFENNSSVANQKQRFCNRIASRSKINIEFSINEANIGADRNILKCCRASQDATFTWVLGDDDHIVAGCIPKILSSLLENKDNLGLLILMDDEYLCSTVFKDTLFKSYEQFARLAIKHQPHLLIAHTLISCNIFRTSLFDLDEASYVIDKLIPRAGLSAYFVHMRGMVKGLLRSDKEFSVLLPSFTSLDTSKRVPGEIDLGLEMPNIYYFYFMWLLVELGVRIEQVPHYKNMWWLFAPKKLKWWRRLFRSPIVPRYI